MDCYPGDYLRHCAISIKQKFAEKRRLRKEWHLHRTPTSKKLFNRTTHELKQLLHNHKNYNIQKFLNGLTPTASTDYSLWKTTKKNVKKSLKLLHRFRRHKEHGQEPMLTKRRLSPITLPLYSNLTHLNPTPFLTTSHHIITGNPFPTRTPCPPPQTVQAIIDNLPPKKSLGYDLMTGKTLMELPTLCIQYLTQLFSAISLRGYSPLNGKSPR
jgi:hypothetical protein